MEDASGSDLKIRDATDIGQLLDFLEGEGRLDETAE